MTGRTQPPLLLDAPDEPVEIVTAAGRRALHVQRRGACVHRSGGQIIVRADGDAVLHAPVGLIDRIVLHGNVDLTPAARSVVLRAGGEIVLLDRRGQLIGRFEPAWGSSPLRQRQHARRDDEHFRTTVARGLISAKLHNQRALLRRYARREDQLPVDLGIDGIGRALGRLERCSAQDEILGTEGIAARRYFEGLAALLPDTAGFTRRSGRHATDPVNAALNFGYALLLGEAIGAVAAAGLDPSLGLLHTDRRRRPSLALDLIEELRPVVVDAIVVELFRRGLLDPSTFSHHPTARLTDAGRHTLIAAYEERMATRLLDPTTRERPTYRRRLHLQARQLAERIHHDDPGWNRIPWR